MSQGNVKSRWIVAAVIGCGLCCLPFLGPLMAGTALAALWATHAGEMACLAVLAAVLAIFVAVHLRKRKRTSCELPGSGRD